MEKDKKKKRFIERPKYPGGTKALQQFIKDHLSYPEAARKAKIEGTVKLRYTINHLGKVVRAEVLSGLGYGCDEEAVRLVKLLRFEVPKNRGVKVQFQKQISIHFRLGKQREKTAGQPSVHYMYKPAAKTAEEEEKEKGGSYNYTISF
jgi:TonB family protein